MKIRAKQVQINTLFTVIYMVFDIFCCFHSFQLIGSFSVHFCFLFVS